MYYLLAKRLRMTVPQIWKAAADFGAAHKKKMFEKHNTIPNPALDSPTNIRGLLVVKTLGAVPFKTQKELALAMQEHPAGILIFADFDRQYVSYSDLSVKTTFDSCLHDIEDDVLVDLIRRYWDTNLARRYCSAQHQKRLDFPLPNWWIFALLKK